MLLVERMLVNEQVGQTSNGNQKKNKKEKHKKEMDRGVGWLVAYCPSNMLVYFRDGSAQTSSCIATLKQKLQIKSSTSPRHRILTPGQPVPALTLSHQVPGRVATGVPIFKSPV